MKLNSTSLILVKVLRYLLIAFVLTISLSHSLGSA